METNDQTTKPTPSPAAPCSAALDALMKHPKTVVNELDSGREDDTAWYIVVPHKYAMQVANERDWFKIRNEALSAECERLHKLLCKMEKCPLVAQGLQRSTQNAGAVATGPQDSEPN